MTFKDIFELERQLVFLLNQSGWDLEWDSDEYSFFDAKGFDKNGDSCIVEMKFRKQYYLNKMLEEKKYNNLINNKNYKKKYYAVVDNKGCFLYDLDNVDITLTKSIECPVKTITDKKVTKIKKIILLLHHDAMKYNYKFFKQ
jgi:hypothetical protein